MHCFRWITRELVGALVLAAAIPAGAQTYKAIGEYKLPGSSAAHLAVDAAGRRLFVAGDQGIAVLNADTGAQLGLVPMKGAQDVLLIPVMNGEEQGASTMGFAIGEGRIISFSLAGLKATEVGRLPTGGRSSLCYDGESDTVEAVSAEGSIAGIDAGSGKMLRPYRVATGEGQIACGVLNQVYVADPAANVVHVLNHQTGQNEGDLPMMTGHKPSGMALDTRGRRLFVACEDGVIEIIDTDSGFTFIQLHGGSGPAEATFAWTPQGKGQWKAAAFVAQSDGTLAAVRMNAFINYTMGGEYKLAPGLNSVAYDPATHHLFLTAMHAGTPVVVVAGY